MQEYTSNHCHRIQRPSLYAKKDEHTIPPAPNNGAIYNIPISVYIEPELIKGTV